MNKLGGGGGNWKNVLSKHSTVPSSSLFPVSLILGFQLKVLMNGCLFLEQKAAEKQNKLAEIMEKQASTVSAMKPAQVSSDGDMKKLLVAQYGHESDDEL